MSPMKSSIWATPGLQGKSFVSCNIDARTSLRFTSFINIIKYRQAGDEACTPLGYGDTAAVPADISVGGELCGPLPGDELCANTQPYNTLGYNDNEVKEPDNCLPELLPPLGYPKPPQSVVDSGFEGCSGNNVLYGM